MVIKNSIIYHREVPESALSCLRRWISEAKIQTPSLVFQATLFSGIAMDMYTRMDHKDTQGILYVLVKLFFLSFHCDHSWNLSMIQYENKYCNILLLLYFQIIVDHQKWPPSKAT